MKKQNVTRKPAISSNGVLPAVIAPMDAFTEKDRLRLLEDNTATENYWLLLNDGHVTLANQKIGQEKAWLAQIPRKEWDKIVKWYIKKQKARGNYGR